MNTETFFQQFELLADAPNGIAKLRELILQLAVQGKLVPQNPDDEPAAVLLERIKAEKERLVKEGKIKKSKKLLNNNQDKTPFKLPDSWEWVRLEELGITQTGTTPSTKKHEYWGNFIPFIKPGNMTDFNISYEGSCLSEEGLKVGRFIPAGSILMVCIGGSTGKTNIIDRDISCNQQINTISPCKSLKGKYLLFSMRSIFFYKQVIEKTGQGTLQIISKSKWEQLYFPVPPLAEQKRIVEKVDRLMELCDKLETQQQQQQTKTLQLGTVATSRLITAKTPEAFQQHWQNISNNFDLIYSTPENIKQLRQTILQLAVMGKLVPQNPDDEPASVLLAKIKAEKEKLIKEGKIKKSKKLKAIAPDEIPYDLPLAWKWVRMQDIFTVITDGDHQAPPKVDSGIPFLVIGNVRDGFLNFDSTRFVPQVYYQSIGETRTPQKGDILYTVVGSYGIPIIIDTDKNFCVQRHIAILKSSRYMDIHYLKYVLQSELVFTQATNCATGIAQKTVSLNGLRKIHIPLPPLAEQYRIVAKVDQLMSYCDELEAKLTQSLKDKEKLMNTAVYQLLTA